MTTALSAAQIPTVLPYLTDAERSELDALLGIGGSRTALQRRRYAGDPWAYFHDVLGWRLTPQQTRALDMIERSTRVLLRGAHNLGKTEPLGGYGLYVLDAVAALPNEAEHLTERGAFVLLPGPDHATVFGTSYSALLRMARRAEQRGYPMPGRRSDKSVHWSVRGEDWRVEAFSPPREAGERTLTHQASGRHHLNQVALIEEAMGLTEALLTSVEGMCSGQGNRVICAFNPDQATGPIWQREQNGSYAVIEWDAFDHPNVQQRTYCIPSAIDFRIVDEAVRTDCRSRGPHPGTEIDPTHGDFLYALPPPFGEEHGPRLDGMPGHPDGELRVYRPSAKFMAQRRGKYPLSDDVGLFDYGAWDAAVLRWIAQPDPATPPDAVGLDPAREGGDEPAGCPRWGADAATLLLLYADCQKDPAQIAQLQATRRIRSGPVRIFKRGDGVSLAEQVARCWTHVAMHIDEGGVGTSCLDHRRRVQGFPATGISFAASAPDTPIPGLPYCENMRTWMYVVAAQVVRLGLIDVPEDRLLREEVLAHELIHTGGKVFPVQDRQRGLVKERKPSVLLIPKSEIKKRIGRSPDRADAWVLSLVKVMDRNVGFTARAAGYAA